MLASSVQRSKPTPYPSRARSALIRRAIVVGLVIVALALVTISFRSPTSGALHDVQGVGSTVLRPFQIAATRIAQPFRDAYDYVDGLANARAQNKRLKKINENLRERDLHTAAQAAQLPSVLKLLHFVQGPSFPTGFRAISTSVTSPPGGPFAHTLAIDAGSSSGVRLDSPVVSGDGLVGIVSNVFPHTAKVTLLTDPDSFASARDVDTQVRGDGPHRAGRDTDSRPGLEAAQGERRRQARHCRDAQRAVSGSVSIRHPDRHGHVGQRHGHGDVPAGAGAAVREPRLARSRGGARPEEATPMTLGDGVKAAALLFVAAVAQVSIFSQVHVFGAVPDVLLVSLVAVALLRGSVAGAVGGFFAGLIVDTASLGTLGLTSLVLTLAGYWIGRYGETTGRDRAHAPFLSVAVVTVLYQLGLLVVHFVLGESAPAGAVVRSLVPAIVLNLILTAPIYALVRRLLRPVDRDELTTEVQLLG